MIPVGDPSHRLGLILPAAGSSTRMGDGPRKPLIEINGLPVLCHTLRRFRHLSSVEQVVVVAHPEDLDVWRRRYWPCLRDLGVTELVPGGGCRQESVARGLAALRPDIDIVLIHDSVRPFVSRTAIDEAVRAAIEHGAALVAMPLSDTVKRVSGDRVAETVSRADLWGAQTPQVFRHPLIRKALEAAFADGVEATDDAQLVERLGGQVKIVRGSHLNIKLTTPEHIRLAEVMLGRREPATDNGS